MVFLHETNTLAVFFNAFCGVNAYDPSIRIDIKYIESYTVEMVILIFYVFCSIALSQVQPLKSRSIVPFVCILAYMMASTVQFILNRVQIENIVPFGCNLSAYLVGCLQTVGYLFSVMNWFRYFLIINLNNFKRRFWDVHDGKVKMNWVFRLLQRMSSGWGLTITGSSIVAVMYAIQIIMGIPFRWSCQTAYSYAQAALNYLYLFLIGLSLLLILGLDVLLNWRKILRCQLRNYFLTSDPYLFRLEKVTFPLMLCLFVIGALANNPATNTVLTPPYANTFIQTLWFHWITSLDVYFIINVTLIRYLFCSRRQKSIETNVTPLDEIFANEELRNKFYEYCKNEWSVENALIKMDINKMKRMSTGPELVSQGKLIFDKYLNGTNSMMAVNITDSLVVPIKEAMGKSEITWETFNNVEASINSNLMDTYSRYRWTPEYTTWKGIQKKQSELLHAQ
jgi:hypothetical protein